MPTITSLILTCSDTKRPKETRKTKNLSKVTLQPELFTKITPKAFCCVTEMRFPKKKPMIFHVILGIINDNASCTFREINTRKHACVNEKQFFKNLIPKTTKVIYIYV